VQSINTNTLFMHKHKNGGASNVEKKVRGQLPPPLPPQFRGLCLGPMSIRA